MTPPRLKDRIVDAVITFIATMFLLFGTGAWALKENAADHRSDMLALTSLVQRTLDAVCDGRAQKPHACHEDTSAKLSAP